MKTLLTVLLLCASIALAETPTTLEHLAELTQRYYELEVKVVSDFHSYIQASALNGYGECLLAWACEMDGDSSDFASRTYLYAAMVSLRRAASHIGRGEFKQVTEKYWPAYQREFHLYKDARADELRPR